VKIRATVEPVIQDLHGQPPVTVIFSPMDVDDPAVSIPAKPNSADIDFDLNPLKVEDNRGDPKKGVIVDPPVPVAAGSETVTTRFQVSQQPGDNYRVGVSTAQDWLDHLKEFQPSTTGEVRYDDGTRSGRVLREDEQKSVSDMLTVWRTLHLEVDSMKAPPTSPTDPQRNFLEGKVTGVGNIRSLGGRRVPTRLTLAVEPNDVLLADGSPDRSTGDGNGRFENGTIRIGAGTGVEEITNILGNGDTFVDTVVLLPFKLAKGTDSMSGFIEEWDAQAREFVLDTAIGRPRFDDGKITVAGVTWTVSRARGRSVSVDEDQPLPFHLVDDDAAVWPFNADSALLTDCKGNSGCEAGTESNIFAQAYVRVSYDLASSDKKAPFVRNVGSEDTDWAAQLQTGRDETTMAGLPEFWTGYIQGGFQETIFDSLTGSGDGDPDSEQTGSTLGGTPFFNDQAGSLIFVEVVRDVGNGLLRLTCPGVDYLSDTVAHELGHQFGLRHESSGIMIQGCPKPHYFSGPALDAIRSKGLKR